MFAAQSTVLTLLAICAASATGEESEYTMKFVDFSKKTNDTGASGNIAASGKLEPFGSVGVGCGIDWNDREGFGGGLTGGSPTYGLGGGFKITPDVMTVDSGIGINLREDKKAATNIKFKGDRKGNFEIQIDSSVEFECAPSNNGSHWFIYCQTKEDGSTPVRRALLEEEY